MGIVTECLANIINDLKKELKSTKAHIAILQATNDDLVKEVNHQECNFHRQCKKYEALDKEYEELKQQLSEK